MMGQVARLRAIKSLHDDRSANFDIYLPLWLARHNKTIFGSVFAAASYSRPWCCRAPADFNAIMRRGQSEYFALPSSARPAPRQAEP